MIVTEMFTDDDENENETKYMDPGHDNEVPTLGDLRKTHLNLGQINRLRLIRDVRNFEQKDNLKNVRAQYGKPAGQESPM